MIRKYFTFQTNFDLLYFYMVMNICNNAIDKDTTTNIIISEIQMGALFPIDLVLQLIKITLLN